MDLRQHVPCHNDPAGRVGTGAPPGIDAAEMSVSVETNAGVDNADEHYSGQHDSVEYSEDDDDNFNVDLDHCAFIYEWLGDQQLERMQAGLHLFPKGVMDEIMLEEVGCTYDYAGWITVRLRMPDKSNRRNAHDKDFNVAGVASSRNHRVTRAFTGGSLGEDTDVECKLISEVGAGLAADNDALDVGSQAYDDSSADDDVQTSDYDNASLDTPLAIPAAFKTAVSRRRLRLRPWWCKRFLTPNGCRRGNTCRFPHLTSVEVAAERRAHSAAAAVHCSEALSSAMRIAPS